MNSPKVVVALGIILICSIVLTACGGGSKTVPPPAGPPTIETASLPQGAVNAPYLVNGTSSVILSAIGGTGAYTWSIASGSLPPGLSLDPAQGIISGTPTTAGNFSFTVKVTDAAGLSATAALSIYIQGVVSITPTTLPSGSAGIPYSQTLTATGGVQPYTWCVLAGSTCDPTQASLPAGLSLNTSTGVISGTPVSNTTLPPGFVSVAVQVADSETLPGHPAIGSANFTIAIMSITTASLPSGYLNAPYSATLTVAGGATPYSWTYANLPPGLTLAPACRGTKLQTCAITGTPTQAGKFSPTFGVTDGEKVDPAMANMSFDISVFQASPLMITTTALPPGTEGVAYNATLTATGGVTPYTWSISSGTLPPGLALDPTTCNNSSVPCVVSGTPTKSGPFNFTVQVQDSGSGSQQQTASQQFSILVVNPPPLVITTTSLPAGLVGVPYSATLMAAGGVKPYTWCIFESDGITCDNGSGILPAGLTLNQSSGLISGTPASQGTSSFNVQVHDSGDPEQTVKTASPLSIVITSLGDSTLNGTYVLNFTGYSNGTLVMMAGSFFADGNGNITSGVLDYNGGNGEPVDMNGRPIPQNLVSGSKYSINPDGSGTMTMVTDLPTTFNFAIAVRRDGSGNLIQSDPANPQAYGSGAIMGTTPLGTGEQWPLCGSPIALGLYGLNNSQTARYAAAGQFQYDPHTCVDAENGTLDIDDGGTQSSATFTGAFNGYDNTTSRGILGITYNGDQSARYFDPYYLISSSDRKQNKLVLLTENVCDKMLKCTPTGATLWSALPRANPPKGWDNTNLSGTAVTELNALDTGPAADVTAGLFVGQGVSGHTCTSGQNNTPQPDPAAFSYDENQGGLCNGGTCGSQPQSSSGTYCVDKNTGRVTLSTFGGAFGGSPPVFYLIKSNQGFVVGTDTAVTSGYLEPQTGSPFSNSSLFGLYAGGSINPVTTNVTNSVASLFADGNGNISGSQDTSGPNGPVGPTNFTYTYSVDNTGRTIVQQSGNTIGIAYVVSGTKFVLLPATDPNPALSVFGQ